MTRKDYINAAKIVRSLKMNCPFADPNHPHYVAIDMTELAFAKFFRDDNPRFDEERFRRACQE